LAKYLLKLSRIDVLVLDDFAMAPLKEQERRDFLEICDDRSQRRSTILTSQVPVATGTSRSAIPASPTASWTGWSTMPTASNWTASPCASCGGGSRLRSRHHEPN
jgi:hypothetical protein